MAKCWYSKSSHLKTLSLAKVKRKAEIFSQPSNFNKESGWTFIIKKERQLPLFFN